MKLDFHQQIQEGEYEFPYHHLVSFVPFETGKTLFWGLEYYAYLTRVLEQLETIKWQSLLEIGCGDGKFIAETLRKFPNRKVTGIDYSNRAILFAKAFNYDNGAELVCGDVAKFQKSFDVVVVIETLEHISDAHIPDFIRAISDRLATGGSLIVTVPTTNAPLQDKHYRHYDIELLKQQFSGYTLKHVQYVVKIGAIRRILFSLATKGGGIRSLQTFAHFIAQRFLFPASERTGRHLVAVFSK